jgi:hypothetical protein
MNYHLCYYIFLENIFFIFSNIFFFGKDILIYFKYYNNNNKLDNFQNNIIITYNTYYDVDVFIKFKLNN